MKRIVTISILAFVLQGCSTTVISSEQRLEARAHLPKVEQKQAQVCFIRENKLVAQTWKPDIKEDGKKIGELGNDQFFCHNTTNGQHKYIASTALDYDREIDMNLTINSRRFVDYTIGMGVLSGNGKLTEVDEETALNKIHEINN